METTMKTARMMVTLRINAFLSTEVLLALEIGVVEVFKVNADMSLC